MSQKINQYEQAMIESLEVELDGQTYKGLELLKQIVKDTDQGNYKLYNMVTATGGMGINSPIGQLLAKLGVE